MTARRPTRPSIPEKDHGALHWVAIAMCILVVIVSLTTR